MDIRISRTQKMLMDAFEQLFSEKSLEEISVSEICERSTVRRNTFYRHFNDKYAFIEFYLESLAQRFMAESESECNLEGIREYARHMHLSLLRFVETHQNSMRTALGQTVPVSTIDMIIKQIAEGITQRAARELERRNRVSEMPIEFLGFFYSAGMVHTLRWWLFTGKPVSAEALEQYCTDFLMSCFDTSSSEARSTTLPSVPVRVTTST